MRGIFVLVAQNTVVFWEREEQLRQPQGTQIMVTPYVVIPGALNVKWLSFNGFFLCSYVFLESCFLVFRLMFLFFSCISSSFQWFFTRSVDFRPLFIERRPSWKTSCHPVAFWFLFFCILEIVPIADLIVNTAQVLVFFLFNVLQQQPIWSSIFCCPVPILL